MSTEQSVAENESDANHIQGSDSMHSSQVIAVPGWFGAEDRKPDIAVADISGNGRSDLLVFHPGHHGGDHHGYYRVGWNFDAAGNISGGWSPIRAVPRWCGRDDRSAGIALADIDGNGRPDLLVCHVDNPGGDNYGYYRIGWNLDTSGQVAGGWGPLHPLPGWFGRESHATAIAVADINSDGRPELIVFRADTPGTDNHGHYRVGWRLDQTGTVAGGWSRLHAVPRWSGDERQGPSIALADVNGNGRLDLIVYHVDTPGGENHGSYRVGFDLDGEGAASGWGPSVPVSGWFGAENQGAGLTAADISRTGRPDLIVFHAGNPGGENQGYYRVLFDL